MSDAEIEQMLRKFRVTGPPQALRDRVLVTVRTPSLRGWLVAAAVLFVTTVLSHASATNHLRRVTVVAPPSPLSRIDEGLIDAFGGDDYARQWLEFMSLEQQWRATSVELAPTPELVVEEGF